MECGNTKLKVKELLYKDTAILYKRDAHICNEEQKIMSGIFSGEKLESLVMVDCGDNIEIDCYGRGLIYLLNMFYEGKIAIKGLFKENDSIYYKNLTLEQKKKFLNYELDAVLFIPTREETYKIIRNGFVELEIYYNNDYNFISIENLENSLRKGTKIGNFIILNVI